MMNSLSPGVSVQEVIGNIRSGDRVFVHGGAATPRVLLRELVRQADRLHDVELIHLHTEGEAIHAAPELAQNFRVVSLFVGGNLRGKLNDDRIDYLPCLLSEIPELFRSGRRRPDVALLSLSPPDRHGQCTLGTSVDVSQAAWESATRVLAQVNEQLPRVHGDGFVPLTEVDAFVRVDEPLPTHASPKIGEVEARIGKWVASLVEDGSCLQAGIGAVPDAALAELVHHRHLGIHTELLTDGFLRLIQAGAVDHSRKKVHRGKCVSTFMMGSRELYEFAHDNPAVIQLGADYVNSPALIARNDRVVAINSAIEVDLTGQVCADSIGHRVISGVGGQMDFLRGAALSERGKPILALPSRTRSGKPRIVCDLAPGAGVVTTRAHVHYVVTEYGVADLAGKTLGERARALIGVAHPEDREALQYTWKKRGTG